jgi:hypothetical protein
MLYAVLWQVLQEAAVGLVVGEEDAGVAGATVAAEGERGVDVRGPPLISDLRFY